MSGPTQDYARQEANNPLNPEEYEAKDLSGADCAALRASAILHDPDLAAIVEAWPNLPAPVRAALVNMARESVNDAHEHARRDG